MSTIRVDNFGPSAGGTTYSARGIAKSWVNFDGTGTIAARDSENVSSLTDNGTGDYTVNFTNSFGAADYSLVTSGAPISGEIIAFGLDYTNLTKTASAIRLNTKTVGVSPTDSVECNATFHGDLA
jgi:hypothetical protein